MDTPWQDLPAAVREAILLGTGDQPVTMAFEDGLRTYETTKPFEGVIPNMQRRWRATDSAWDREELGRYQSVAPCESCVGPRLQPAALAVTVGGIPLYAGCALSHSEADV